MPWSQALAVTWDRAHPSIPHKMELVGYKDALSHCEGLCVKEKKHFAIILTVCGRISIIPD